MYILEKLTDSTVAVKCDSCKKILFYLDDSQEPISPDGHSVIEWHKTDARESRFCKRITDMREKE